MLCVKLSTGYPLLHQKIIYNLFMNKILQGDSLEVLKTLPDESVDCVITSPPYWALRDYGVNGQLGLEPTFQEYITKLCDIFDEVKRVLKKDGTCWVNLGDTYGGSGKGAMGVSDKSTLRNHSIGDHEKKRRLAKESWTFKKASKENGVGKCLAQIPSRFAIEMTNRGWILRNEIIWHKPNCMPSSVKDRFTIDFEKVFFFVKSKKYWFETQYEPLADITQKRLAQGKWESRQGSKINKGVLPMSANSFNKAILKMAETGERNKRCVWQVSTKPFKEAHFATFPEKLI